MTLVQLRHFVSLAQTGSFSKAAQAQFITQPALSRSIQALEEELGVPLFDRINRRVELTPFGREALGRAQHVLASVEDLRDSAELLTQGLAGTLRVGMGSGPGAMLMTPLLLHAARERPKLRVQVSRANTELLVQALRERMLDALVLDARSLIPAPDLHIELVHEMRGVFMVRPGHPLTQVQGGVSFAAVSAYPVASTPLSHEIARMLVERYGPAAHPDQCVTLRCEEVPSLVEVARHSDAVLLAIRAAAPDLVELQMDPPLVGSGRFGLVTLAHRSEPPGLALVRQLMTVCLR